MDFKKFDVKSFWSEIKELFPDIDLSDIKEGTGQWGMTTKPIIMKKLF